MRIGWLDVGALATGGAVSAIGLALSLPALRAFAHLPADPVAFAQAYRQVGAPFEPVVFPLGFAFVLFAVFDAARFASLRAARVTWRLVGIGCVFGLGLSDAIAFDPLLEAIDSGAAPTRELAARADSLRLLFAAQRALLVLLAVSLLGALRAPGPPPIVPGERYASRFVPPLFGRTPELPERQWRVLGLMIAASFFNAYDTTIFSLALKQIQAGLQIEEAGLGVLGAVISLGLVPGVLLALTADTLGRRRLLLVTIAGYTACTGATAFAPDAWSFVALQFGARAFGAAEGVLAAVVVAEEIDAGQRGWALGVLSGLSAFGVGLALLLFAFVDALPMGWRALYLVGLGPLAIIAYLRRTLPETRRFLAQPRGAPAARPRDLLRPVRELLRAYPRRFAAVSSVVFLMSFSGQSAGFFLPKYMQDEHSWSPEQFALLGAVIGFFGVCALPIFGRLGDRFGRKPVAITFIALNPLAVTALYNATGPVLLPALWLAMQLSDLGSDTNLGTFGQELFPTSHRSTADGARRLVGQVGGSLGLAIESALYGVLGSHALAISALALAGLGVPFIVGFGYPETSGRTLEDISPERPAG